MAEDRSSDAFAATAVPSDLTSPTTTADSTARAARPRDSLVTLEIGNRLGDRYDIRGYLGEGGMGSVYRAFDAVLGTEVALKVVRGGYASDATLRDEVRIAQQVTHPNVCRTYDLEDVAGYHLIKMEYVAGETLASRLAEAGKLPVAEAVRIARGVVAGLAAAHARGIVHRDLKPGNVMLAGDRVVLMDFGLARQITDEELERAGTPGYMSPEQLAGGRVDARSDLYALGCLVYEMLAGERAFAHGTMTEVAARRAAQPAPDLRAKRPDAPRRLVRATQLLMATDPAAREGGLALLVADPRRRRWIAIGATLAAGIALGNAWWIYRALRTEAAPPPWQPLIAEIPIEITQARIDRPAISPDGTRLAVLIDRLWAGHPVLYTVPYPAGGVPERVANQPDAPINGARWRRGGGFVIGIDDVPGGTVGVLDDAGFTPWGRGHDPIDCNGEIVAFGNPQYPNDNPWNHGDSLVRYTAPNAKPKQLLAAEATAVFDHPRCDAAGRIVFKRFADKEHGIWIADGKTTPHALTDGPDATPAFTPDGSAIVFIRRVEDEKWELFTRRIAVPTSAERLTFEHGNLASPEPDPRDPNTLVFVRDELKTGIFLYDGTGGARLITEDAADIKELLVVPDNSGVVAWSPSANGGAIAAFDLGGRRTELAHGGLLFVSLDSKRVYFATDAAPTELWSVPIDGSHPAERVASLPGKIAVATEASDGIHVVVEGDADPGSFRLDHGVPVAEPDHGLVIPAPSGSWRAVQTEDEVTLRAGSTTRRLHCLDVLIWVDDHHAGCSIQSGDQLQLVTQDVAQEQPTVIAHDTMLKPVVRYALGRAGHWAAIQEVTPSKIQRITNLASRPGATP